MKTKFIKTNSGVFDADLASGITATQTGVGAYNASQQLIAWIAVEDEAMRKRVAADLSDVFLKARMGEDFEQLNWADYDL